MKDYILEICVDSVESAINAERGGADRIELCGNLIIGGTTPPLSLFKEVKKNVNIPVRVMIRPRFGDFLYTEYEKRMMEEDIKIFKELKADGVVFGALTEEGEIDVELCEKLTDISEGMSTTFHRAYDLCRNPIKAFDELKEMKINTVLTSGQKNSCIEGKELIKKLIEISEKNMEILVGAGLNINNVKEVIDYTKARAFHFSAKKILNSRMLYKKSEVSMGLKEFSEYEKIETEENLVREMKNCLDFYIKNKKG